MCRQLDRFRAAGLDGVVFHPRFYPGNPPYLSEAYFNQVNGAILHARSIGLAFWIYDEDGWPSGTVGGQLLRRYPEYAQRWVGLYPRRTGGCTAEFEHDGNPWYLAEHLGAGVDYLEPGMCRRFVEMTYEGYRDGLSAEAFEYVEAFFCDEPEFGLGHVYGSLPPGGAIPWTARLPELYREHYGDDLIPLLPSLFFAIDGHEEVRIRFYQLLCDLFCEGFIGPVNDWCREHGKRFTGHIKGEEHPLFQVPMVGSCHPVFRAFSLPGIDALERHPSNDFYPRQVSSAARQFGDGRCMVEAFGGAGWGATPEDLERYLLWLGGHGLTDFVMHLSQYQLDSAAIQDWPPSQPLHLSWSEVYPHVLDRVRDSLHAHPRRPADTLVVAPYRGIMGAYEPWELMRTNVHDAGTYPDTDAGRINDRFLTLIEALHHEGVAYDVTDERTVEQFAALAGSRMKLGNCFYDRVILGEGSKLEPGTLSFVEPFIDHPDIAHPIETSSPTHTGTVAEAVAIPLHWRLDASPINSLLLESTPGDGTRFTARFTTETPSPQLLQTRLIFADNIEEVILNGISLPVESLDDGTSANIPSEIMWIDNILLYRTVNPVSRPFVWLEGSFRVASLAPFETGPSETVKTEGPFVIRPGGNALQHNLVAGGFPFLRESLAAVAEVHFPCVIESLRLDGADASAVRLAVDDRDLGWTWRTDGEIRFALSLAAGTHRLRIELLPNSYNAFGPHHYYNGDWFVVSPDQMKGVRNFADAPGAPELTHLTAWHFRRLTLPSTVTLCQFRK
jgi:hypothetical protein